MRSRVIASAAVAIGMAVLLSQSGVWAHHAFSAEFDAKKPVKLKGKVTKVELINPHSWIHIAVVDPDGTTVNWMIEGGSPNALIRRGVTQQILRVGMEISVDGYQAKDGSTRANGRDITLADGRKLSVASSGTGAPEDTPTK